MDFLKTKLNKLGQNAQGMLATAKKSLQTTMTEAKTTIAGHSVQQHKALYNLYHPKTASDFLVNICEQVYFMPFPEESLRPKYAEILKKEYTVNYRIWNVSEYSYDYRLFNDQVCEYVSVGYPNPPLIDLFMVCKEIVAWVDCMPGNIAIVHCQKSKTRSCLVLGCLLYYRGIYPHPGPAMSDVCQLIGLPEGQVLEACNSVYANYFALLYSNLKLNQRKIRLQKLVVSELPSTELRVEDRAHNKVTSKGENEAPPLRPYLQVFYQNKLVHTSLTKANPVPVTYTEAQPVSFHIGVAVDGDVLIRVRNFISESVRYPILRLMANSTFFLQSPMRFHRKDIDFGDTAAVPDHFYLDLYVDFEDEASDYQNSLLKIRLREKILNKPIISQPKQEVTQNAFEIGGGEDSEESEPPSPVPTQQIPVVQAKQTVVQSENGSFAKSEPKIQCVTQKEAANITEDPKDEHIKEIGKEEKNYKGSHNSVHEKDHEAEKNKYLNTTQNHQNHKQMHAPAQPEEHLKQAHATPDPTSAEKPVPAPTSTASQQPEPTAELTTSFAATSATSPPEDTSLPSPAIDYPKSKDNKSSTHSASEGEEHEGDGEEEHEEEDIENYLQKLEKGAV